MIGSYWIKEHRSACDGGASYYNFGRDVERIMGEGQSINCGHGTCWEMEDKAVILSSEQGWTPRFTLIPDSEELKEKLERLLKVNLIKS